MKPKKKTPIQAIIFDLGNVLLNYDSFKAAREFSKKCRVPLTRVVLHFFASPTEKAYTRGEISSYEFYRHAKRVLKVSIRYTEFRDYWNDIFWERSGMDGLLGRLKKRYPLYLISNTNAMHFNYIKTKYRVLRHFKKTFPSHEMGLRKPDRKIYEKVLARIRRRPEQTVFIDDALSFVAGAKKAGMHAVHFRNKSQLVRSLRKLGVRV